MTTRELALILIAAVAVIGAVSAKADVQADRPAGKIDYLEII